MRVLLGVMVSVAGAAAPVRAAPVGEETPDRPGFTAEERSFWAFVPPADPPVPSVEDDSWPLSPLDRFILAGLEAQGLRPAPRASKAAVIRRAAFDLTGLPPSPEEIEAFLADDSPDAFARVVDRLLASPRHGERWGRHWLDVARFADSNGMDENLCYGNAWRYRDYVISAFNADKPYDRFLREQIAGDLLAPGGGEAADPERFVATGFLSIGPKMLAEDDPVKMEMDIIDEQVDTVGRVFLGLTLGCARCHAHKYDPISMEDYYALAGIFKSTRTMDNFKVVARWHERPLASNEALERKAAAERDIAAKRGEIQALGKAGGERVTAEARSRAPEYAAAAAELSRRDAALAALKPVAAAEGGGTAPGAVLVEAEDFACGNVKKDFTDYGKGIGVIYNRGELPNFAEYEVAAAAAGPHQIDLRYAAAEARPVKLFVNGRLARADAAWRVTGSWTPEAQAWEAAGVFALAQGRNRLRLERDGPFPHLDKIAVAPFAPPPGGAFSALPRGAEELAAERRLNAALLELWVQRAAKGGDPEQGLTAERFLAFLDDPKGPLASPGALEPCLPPETRAAIARLRGEAEALEKALPVLPEAMAVEEGKAEDLHVHLRGSHLSLGREAPRRFPAILAGAGGAPIDRSRSGRLELADWLARPDHPLTSRVMVNRIWRWHFGAGIVRTPDNFGRLGALPANQPLLDWLARRFVEGGWSMKAMHRLILLSATYQMSSAYEARAAAIDPEERLHWRHERRRLEAEAVRDAILASSGGLDLAMGGTLLRTKDREYVATTASTNATSYASPRRSVYLPVVRSALYEALQAFDFADPSTSNGDRDTTTVAPQALFLMNSDLILAESRRMAERILAEAPDDAAGRLERAYLIALGRPPAPAETQEALELLDRYAAALGAGLDPASRRVRSWQALAKAILSSNEFIHVE